jgi:hypothetical protein
MSPLALARDVDVGAVVLGLAGNAWPSAQVHVSDSIVGGTIDRTMDGASTLQLQLEDPRRALLRSGIFDDQVDLPYGGQWWRLVQVQKSGDTLNLSFEDRVVSLLRQQTRPRKASRSKMTRAEFVLSLVNELKPPPPFVSPQLHVRQNVAPITMSSQQLSASARTTAAGGGFAPGANLTVKGVKATQEQIGLAQRALDVAASLQATTRVQQALLEACIVESTITNPTTPSADGYGSRGIVQVRDVTAASMGISNTDVEQCVNAWLTRGFTGAGGGITYAAKNPNLTTGQIAQAIEGSAYPGRYDQYATEASRWVAAYQGKGGTGTVSVAQATSAQPFQFQRGGTNADGQNSWECMTKLAQDVKWRCFVVDGAVWFVSEATLVDAQPVATLSEDTLGIDTIDFDVDNGKAKSQATVTARASRWAFAPGSCVVLENCGPADGRWLVQDYSRGLFDAAATITLKRETEPLREPAAQQTTTATPTVTTAAGATVAATPAGLDPLVAKAYAAAQVMDAQQYPYVWGGGHARCGTPDGGVSGGEGGGIGLTGYDCSGSSCAVLGAAQMGYALGGPVDVSGTIAAKWGAPGEGDQLTVWASSIHVWLEFKPPGRPAQHFGTGQWGINNPTDGPRFQVTMHPKDGFTPRHWPANSRLAGPGF